MSIDGGLRLLFRERLLGVHITTIETGLTGRGVPDAHVCQPATPCPTCGSRGYPAWIEFKQTEGWAVTLEPEQVAWLTSYVRRGGAAFVAVRRRCDKGPRRPAADDLYMIWGGQAREAKDSGLRGLNHGLLGHWTGGPSRWAWDEVKAILTRRSA